MPNTLNQFVPRSLTFHISVVSFTLSQRNIANIISDDISFCLALNKIVSIKTKGCAVNWPKPTQPNQTCRIGSVFRGWWIGLGCEFFFFFFFFTMSLAGFRS